MGRLLDAGACRAGRGWIEARTLEVLLREAERWRLLLAAEGDERVRAAPFEAIELDLARLWAL